MNTTIWRIKGPEFINCNCAYGCPCQFNSLPTQGSCEAVGAMRIDQGHFGDTTLDGLCWAMTLKWPGPIHEGGGQAQAFIDERASAEQRQALLAIMSGETSEPGATFFNVFASTLTQMHDPVFCAIALDVDIDARTAKLVVPGSIDSTGEPIRNPVTGETHRARIELPQGFEYAVAEVASGTTTTSGAIALALTQTHSHMAMLDIGPKGVFH